MYMRRWKSPRITYLTTISTPRSLSLTCRGKPIQHEQLFTYTNGRFLVNEKLKLSKRYAKFDLDALCAVVSSLPQISSPIATIDKMEGGFNKVLLMTAENGKQVIAKMPFPNLVPAKYVTASEVAVLEYLGSHTSVPVPKVIGWSSDSSNPVGSEYILMEKASGKQLFQVWGEMNQLQQFSLIKSLVQLESQLAAMQFPAYGSLYLWDSVSQLDSVVPIDDKYCLGPMYNASWFSQLGTEPYAGPWKDLSELGPALTGRGLVRLQHSTLTPRGPHFGTLSEHREILEATKKILPSLAGLPAIQKLFTPTIWHSDLHMGNIYVSEEDPTTIVSIIDWQFISIMPAFMQVQWPTFLSPPENYDYGLVKPELPANFDGMDEDEKAFARTERDQAFLSKCYEAGLAKYHFPLYLALTQIHSPVRHLLSFCENTTKNGIVPLRDSLTEIINNWTELGLTDTCPFRIHDYDLSKHQDEMARYKDWQTLKGYTQELLHTDDDGWISPQLDFDKVRARHDELFQLYMQRETEDLSESEAKRLWFYTDNT